MTCAEPPRADGQQNIAPRQAAAPESGRRGGGFGSLFAGLFQGLDEAGSSNNTALPTLLPRRDDPARKVR